MMVKNGQRLSLDIISVQLKAELLRIGYINMFTKKKLEKFLKVFIFTTKTGTKIII